MRFLILACTLIMNVVYIHANEFYIDDHKIPDTFFKDLRSSTTQNDRLAKLNEYIGKYVQNKTKAYEEMPFIYRKIYGNQKPKFHHDEVQRDRKLKWDPEHLANIESLPFLKRVWARTTHPQECTKCNGLDDYKRKLDEKIVEKIKNITIEEEKLRHGANHEKCHSHGNCDTHEVHAAVVYEDVASSEERKREEEILKEQKRKDALEKLNYHFYRRAIMESKLTGEPAEQIFKQYHKMNPEQLQQRFHAVYQKYLDVRRKMAEYYQRNKQKEPEVRKEFTKSVEKKENVDKQYQAYQQFLRHVQLQKLKEEEAKKAAEEQKVAEQKRIEEEQRKERERIEQQRHKELYEKYLAEQRKAQEQKQKEEEYKRKEIENVEKQLAEIQVLKENIKREIERTRREGDEKDLQSLERLREELLQWENKVQSDKQMKVANLDIIVNKINDLKNKLLNELKAEVVHGNHRNEESFENAKKRYLHVKENFNKQLNQVRDNLVKPEEEEYDSSVYKDESEEEEPDYNTHERQLNDIDDIKTHLTNELDKAKKEGKNIRDIYQLEGAKKQIEDWEARIKDDNALHYEKANIVNRKIKEFKGFLDSYKLYKYSTTPVPQ